MQVPVGCPLEFKHPLYEVDSLKWGLQIVRAYSVACQHAILPPLGIVGRPERECYDFHYVQKPALIMW